VVKAFVGVREWLAEPWAASASPSSLVADEIGFAVPEGRAGKREHGHRPRPSCMISGLTER
jgi:hypothetical protein